MVHNEVDKDAMTKNGGRGAVKCMKKCPEQKKERSSWDKRAEKQLSQARRCEQMAYKIQILEHAES